MKLTLNRKILIAAAITVVLTTVSAISTVYFIAKSNRVNELHLAMQSMNTQANGVRDHMEYLHRTGSIDLRKIAEEVKAANPGKALKDVYRDSPLFRAIPIVATWQSIQEVADEKGFDFRIASRPGSPARNPQYEALPEDQAIFDRLAAGEKEVFFEDRASNTVVLATPVLIGEGCLKCHGDPATSPTRDGRDILGMQMENMKAGDLRAAFILRAPLTDDEVVGQSMATMSLVGGVVLLVTLGGFGFFTRYYIEQPLNQAMATIHLAVDETAVASREIAQSSERLADGASSQAASLEETSASLEEMSSVTERNTSGVHDVAELTEAARASAEAGSEDIKGMTTAMDEIMEAGNSIARIVRSIDEIAFQTNILALNAAVEAARAGAAGAGFAVVADEVRNLARRSAEAAHETTAVIEDSIAKSRRGVEMSTKVSGRLEEVLTKVRSVDELLREISTASKEQQLGIQQINLAVNDIDQITQANAATAEETSAAANQLGEQIQRLVDSVEVLESMTGLQVKDLERSARRDSKAPRTSQRPSAAGKAYANRDAGEERVLSFPREHHDSSKRGKREV